MGKVVSILYREHMVHGNVWESNYKTAEFNPVLAQVGRNKL